jgi:surface protein
MIDVETYGAAVGAAKRYTDEHSGSDDAVKYTEQELTDEQQAQARENIGAAASDDIPTDAVKYTAQTLTDAQKTQARTNIGAGTSNFTGDYNALRNAPPIAKSNGTYAAAGGYYSTASGQYGFAFGNRVVTTHAGEVAFGKHNESSEDTAFAIGDGRDIQYRHNLMELKTDGTLLLNGNAVKTEGGDDNKLRLGQICAVVDGKSFKQGFDQVFGTSTTLAYITFNTDDFDSSSTYERLYCFGDFVGYRESNVTSLSIRPLAARTSGITKSGAWICVENCFKMFFNCTAVSSLNLSMFDTSEVKNMKNMFTGCTRLTSLDLSSFDTSKVKDMASMFYRCTALTTLDISSFDMSNVIAYDKMFGEASYWAGITTLKCPKINPHDDIPLPRTLYSQDGTAYTNLPVTTGTSIELRQSWT